MCNHLLLILVYSTSVQSAQLGTVLRISAHRCAVSRTERRAHDVGSHDGSRAPAHL